MVSLRMTRSDHKGDFDYMKAF